jgi:toxin ParE1/3/4
MQLKWSPFAIEDRIAIFDFIEQDSFHAAAVVDDRISKQVNTLKDFPEIGRPGRVKGTRELVIDRTPYIAAYCIQGDTVRILRMLHGSRQWPEELSEGGSSQ